MKMEKYNTKILIGVLPHGETWQHDEVTSQNWITFQRGYIYL